MKKVIILLFVFAAFAMRAGAQYVSLSNDEFGKLKNLINNDPGVKAAFEPFETQASKALTEEPDPIERIASEGKLAGDPDKIKTGKAVEDVNKIYALALVYKIDGNKACLDKVAQYLQAWAKVNKSCGDPIDETKLENLIIGYDIVRNAIDPQVKKQVDSWLQDIADGELNSKYMAPGRGTAINNWNSHRIKIMAMIVYTLHNDKYEKIVQNELTKQIAINLNADGSGHDFEERDALHYHIYTLEPLITAAMVIYRATGKDYFNYESEKGSSIKKSVDFLVPFVTGEKTHGEFLNSHVAFDRARAKNNEKEYQPGSKFNPLNGVHVLEQAAYFNDKYLAAVKQATAGNTRHSNEWELVLNRVRKPVGSN
ncbi:MAG: hypothetical protein JWQ79_2733 [Mucilaginibacter sp.]|nr:hypothetical protein [Mucilaginibacter sp.]